MSEEDPGGFGGRATTAAGSRQFEEDPTLWRRLLEANDRAAFCRAWLALQVHAIPGASFGLIALGPADKGPYVPVASWPEGRKEVRSLARAAERALVERKGVILKRTAEGALEASGVHLAVPVLVDSALHGAVALEIPPGEDTGLQAAMRQLQWGAAWMEVFLRRESMRSGGAASESLRTALELLATAVGEESFRASATSFLTESAARLACDRASLGAVRGSRVQLAALSNSIDFKRNTNLARAIEAAMEEAHDQEQTVVYPALEDSGFQITLAHEELVRRYGAGSLCSVPLARGDRHCGVLTFERPAARPFDAADVELCEAVAALVGPVLEMERLEERWIGAKAWDSLRTQARKLVAPRHGVFKLVTGLVLAVALILFFARMDYRVSAPTTIEAEVQRVAVAPFNSYVKEAPLRAGDLVEEGDVLCVLDDSELRLERHRLASEKQQLDKERSQALAEGERAEVKIVGARIDQIDAQLALLDDQLARTLVRAPLAGIIVSGDLSQAIGAPLERGQVLFEVAPLEAYRVILEVDERDVAEVQPDQRGELVLSAFPGVPLAIRVDQVTPVSLALEGRNYFRVEAVLEDTNERLRPGMEGIGKVTIGRRRVIWVWTHQAIDWVRLFFWSWTP